MANPVKIKINKVEDRSPEERKEWRRNYLTRKATRKTARNQRVRNHISNLRRTLLAETSSTDATEKAKAPETLKRMYSALDKAAKAGVIHKSTAARRKSRYNALVKANA